MKAEKPNKRRTPDCNELVARAITEDQTGSYETALVLYREVIGVLLDEMKRGKKKSQQKENRKQLKGVVQELLCRAEELQEYLSSRERKSKQMCNTLCLSRHDPSAEDPENNGNRNEGDGAREWAFKFDLNFDMKCKIKKPVATPPEDGADSGGIGGLLSPIIKLVRMIGH